MKHICLILVSLALLIGCSKSSGPPLAEVKGTLLLKGVPQAEASLVFVKKGSGARSLAQTDAEGRFRLLHQHGGKGAEPGVYRVEAYQKPEPLPIPKNWKPESPEAEPPVKVNRLKMSDGSPVEVEITATGPNDLTIDFR